MKVILSIKPKFIEKIISGEKEYEFRKVIFKDSRVNKIVVYSSAPISKVVGEFDIKEIIKLPLNDLWELTKESSGIEEEFFYQYFGKKEYGYALKIENFKLYKKQFDIWKKYGVKAPQSFAYIKE